MAEVDRELLERCARGDQSAWRGLVSRFAPLVVAIARSFGLDEGACEDVSQSVFGSLVKSLPSIREPAALPGWISTASRRVAQRRREQERSRAARETARSLEHSETANPHDDVLVKIERQAALRRGLQDLGGRCKELLEALYLRRQTPDYAEVGRLLGMPVGSIGPTQKRCIEKLGEIVRDGQARDE